MNGTDQFFPEPTNRMMQKYTIKNMTTQTKLFPFFKIEEFPFSFGISFTNCLHFVENLYNRYIHS